MWLYENKEFTDPGEYYGFVYEITCQLNGRKYIGKKFFTKAATRQVNKKKKKYRKESDWKEYYGSNQELLADIKEFGEEHFTRKILYLCRNRGLVNYLEAKEQMIQNVLEKKFADGTFVYYNSWISCKVHRSTVNLTNDPR